MAATIIDVAKLCGYSKATVSRAYASPETVSEKTREKVYAAAKKLNYAPNAIARAMVRQQTENIAFIIHEKQYPAILNPFYSPLLEAAMQEGTRRNYSLFVTTSQDIRLPNGDVCIKKHMDGVIFAGEADLQAIEAYRSQNIPVVLVNNRLDLEGLLCVSADHYRGAVLATAHLCERGTAKSAAGRPVLPPGQRGPGGGVLPDPGGPRRAGGRPVRGGPGPDPGGQRGHHGPDAGPAGSPHGLLLHQRHHRRRGHEGGLPGGASDPAGLGHRGL
jgi:hypothetical protein